MMKNKLELQGKQMQSKQLMVKSKSQMIPLKMQAPASEALQGLTQQVHQALTGRKRQLLKKKTTEWKSRTDRREGTAPLWEVQQEQELGQVRELN
jgi:hypothetical protein